MLHGQEKRKEKNTFSFEPDFSCPNWLYSPSNHLYISKQNSRILYIVVKASHLNLLPVLHIQIFFVEQLSSVHIGSWLSAVRWSSFHAGSRQQWPCPRREARAEDGVWETRQAISGLSLVTPCLGLHGLLPHFQRKDVGLPILGLT